LTLREALDPDFFKKSGIWPTYQNLFGELVACVIGESTAPKT